MAFTHFEIRLDIRNAQKLQELQMRMSDLSIPFENIVIEWAKGNIDKFALSAGKEASGADVDATVHWEALTEDYMKAKHAGGAAKVTKKATLGSARYSAAYPDWLMVRTGALREALSDPSSIFQSVEPTTVTFGTPTDPDLAAIVAFQLGSRQKNRQIVFLGRSDMLMIEQQLQAYFSYGPGYQSALFGKGLESVESRKPTMSIDWGNKVDMPEN
jgi:hypothetical protein